MAVESEDVERLMGWLVEGGPARALAGGEQLVEKLAVVVFHGDHQWPESTGRAGDYREALGAWLARDGWESQFLDMVAPDADAGVFLDWFLPVVLEWEELAARGQGDEQQDQVQRGWRNPNFDGTPGTGYYRIDAVTGEYLYAENEDDQEWADYERRRYGAPAGDDAYGLTYRFDRRDGVYQWLDEPASTWRDQAWADAHAASSPGAGAGGAQRSVAAWDEERSMFYRLGPDGTYEYADAMTPGDEASGCGEVWLGEEQARTRVMPVHLIPGWRELADEPWAQGWYALPDGSGGYLYCYAPGRAPLAGDEGWSPVPPAPAVPLTAEQEEEYTALGFTLDEAADVIDSLTDAFRALAASQK